MAQHQCVLGVVGRVALPPLVAGLAGARGVAAVEGDALVGTPAALHWPDGDVGQRWGFCEEPRRVVQPAFPPVEIERRDHLGVDSFVRVHIADRSARAQAEKDDFVAKGMRGKRDRGPRYRQLTRLAVQIVPPRFGVVTASSS